MKPSSVSKRRNFLRASAGFAAGTLAAGGGWALAGNASESALRRCDRDVARILSTYGRTREFEDAGHHTVGQGRQARRLPVSRVRMEVLEPEAFRRSFEKLASLSDRVLVRGNEARFARAGRFFVIDNRIA